MVWQQILCGYSLISATTPCLKGFLGRFRTEDLARLTEADSGSRTYVHNSRVNTRSDSYALDSIHRSKNRSKRNTEYGDTARLTLRPMEVLHSTTVYAGLSAENGDGSMKSLSSDKMMIHRKVEYDVTTT